MVRLPRNPASREGARRKTSFSIPATKELHHTEGKTSTSWSQKGSQYIVSRTRFSRKSDSIGLGFRQGAEVCASARACSEPEHGNLRRCLLDDRLRHAGLAACRRWGGREGNRKGIVPGAGNLRRLASGWAPALEAGSSRTNRQTSSATCDRHGFGGSNAGGRDDACSPGTGRDFRNLLPQAVGDPGTQLGGHLRVPGDDVALLARIRLQVVEARTGTAIPAADVLEVVPFPVPDVRHRQPCEPFMVGGYDVPRCHAVLV